MSRALRYAPPVAERGLVARPRLLAHLYSRFERPVTALIAPPGFGKTTLLAQAVRENELSPRGADRWLTCQRDDVSLSFLASGMFAAVGLTARVPEDPREAAAAVADAIWSAAPDQIALVLDDAHAIARDSPGGVLLAALVEELPRNGHLVLAARPPAPLYTSRLLASGDAIVLGEPDLQFQPDEVADFAHSRGVPVELLSTVGGWPALAELTATVGPHAVTGYVWEELLSQLSPERRHALSVLVAVGGADEEIARALLGPELDLERLVANLPLVVRAPSGWCSLHGLWASALQHHLDAGQVAEARRTAGIVLGRRRQYHEAMALLMDAEAWDAARDLIVEVCEMCTPLVPTDVLELWLHRLPSDVRSSAEGLLLTAMVAEPTNPATAERILDEAIAIAPPDADVTYACVNALIQLAFWRSDRQQMKMLAARLAGFAERGHAQAIGWAALLDALLAPKTEQARTALASPSLVTANVTNPIHDWLHAHLVLLRLGDPTAAEPLARRALSHEVTTMRAVSRGALVESLRLRGDIETAGEMLPDLLADMIAPKVLTSPELVVCAVVLLCVLGRRDQAQDMLRNFGPTVHVSPVTWAPIADGLAAAFLDAAGGDDEAARATLRRVVDQGVARNTSVLLVSASALPILYVLVPDTRATWDVEPLPGVFADLLALCRALVEVREQGSIEGVRGLSAASRHLIRATLPPPWAAEVALAMVAAGDDAGRALVDSVGVDARTTLRRQLATPHAPIARAARMLLRELPPSPTDQLGLRMLGPTALTRNGNAVTAPELRRERVRQLLGYLLCHDRPTRAAITADLWPDLDEAAAGRNLRTTLAYLQNLLEPDRGELDPPYFVRASGSSLHLVADAALVVDVLEFERAVDEAELLERQGALSSAVASYERAIEFWGGDFLVDVAGADWLEREQARLRERFVAAAIRAGNLQLARGDAALARASANRALVFDEWSEAAYQLLIASYLAAGEPAAAQRAVGRCAEMLRALGVPPQPQTRDLARRVRERH